MVNKIIEISSAEELQAIATDLRYRNQEKGCFVEDNDRKKDGAIVGNFILINDIDLSDIDNFQPIGLTNIPFEGNFNANGYAIKNLTINKPAENNVGLFGSVNGKNMCIENVKLINANIAAKVSVGGIVGHMWNGLVSNCSVSTNSIGFILGFANVGGLVGFMWNGVTRGFNDGVVKGGNNTGGVVGHVFRGTVEGYNNGVVIGDSKDSSIAAVVGYIGSGNVRGYNRGHVRFSNIREEKLVGRSEEAVVNDRIQNDWDKNILN